jgi:hypothetical protein
MVSAKRKIDIMKVRPASFHPGDGAPIAPLPARARVRSDEKPETKKSTRIYKDEFFEHEYAEGAHVSRTHAAGGGFVPDLMVVMANIPLDESHPDFDQAKVDELKCEALKFAKQNFCSKVIYHQGSIRTLRS